MMEFEKKFKTFDDLYSSKLQSYLNEKKVDKTLATGYQMLF